MTFNIRRFAIGVYILAGTIIASWAESYLILLRSFPPGKPAREILEMPVQLIVKGMLKLPFFFYLSMILGTLLIICSFLIRRPVYEYDENQMFIDNCDNDYYYYGWLFSGTIGIITIMVLSFCAVKDHGWNYVYVLHGLFVYCAGALAGGYEIGIFTSFMRNYIIDTEGIVIIYPFNKRKRYTWNDFRKISFEKLLLGQYSHDKRFPNGYLLTIWHRDAKYFGENNPKNVFLYYLPDQHERIFSYVPERLYKMIRNMPKEYGEYNERRNPYKKVGKMYTIVMVIIYIIVACILFHFLK